MIKCYTLDDSLSDGIAPKGYSCILNDVPRMLGADLHLVPVLPEDDVDSGTPAPALAFLTAYEKCEKPADGAIIAVRPSTWSLGTENSQPVLLDVPRVFGKHDESGKGTLFVLLYVPPCSSNVLVRQKGAFPETMSTDEHGVPHLNSVTRGALMFMALGGNLTSLLPGQSREAPAKAHRASKAAAKRSASAVQPRPAR